MQAGLGKREFSQTLTSVSMIASGDISRDAPQLADLARLAASKLEYFELIVAASRPDRAWLDAIKIQGSKVPNIRLVLFDTFGPEDYDRLLINAVKIAIGDIVLVVSPGEFGFDDLDAFLTHASASRCEVIKSRWTDTRLSIRERTALKTLSALLKIVTGQTIQPFLARTICVKRDAVSQILSQPALFRNFRLTDNNYAFREETVDLVPQYKRGAFVGLRRKLNITSHLLAAAAPRLLSRFAALALLLSVASLMYGVYAILTFLFRTEVASGWTSISLVISTMFGMIFALLATVSLGMLRILDLQEKITETKPTQEFNNADLFSGVKRLNVELDLE